MPDAPPATVEDMFVQTASGIRTDDGAMTLLGLTPHTIYLSDRPERIVGHSPLTGSCSGGPRVTTISPPIHLTPCWPGAGPERMPGGGRRGHFRPDRHRGRFAV
jgi:hypothetical protein